MSKPSRRSTREARKQHKLKRRGTQRQLCARRAEVGRRVYRIGYVLTRLRLKSKRRSIRRSRPAGSVSGAAAKAAERFEQDP